MMVVAAMTMMKVKITMIVTVITIPHGRDVANKVTPLAMPILILLINTMV